LDSRRVLRVGDFSFLVRERTFVLVERDVSWPLFARSHARTASVHVAAAVGAPPFAPLRG
jgi:hypothetical protein